ncbi:flavodoxin family protein [Eggerthella sinensis]|uniref:flavodoxin family protein n=1 Tax=Eggerthella sinensis TaxID=242230 RepID=UPI00248F2050|nr:flavodoxin family protein [Eggerthella sinensis]
MKRLIISGSPRARGRSAGVAEAVRFAFEDDAAASGSDDEVMLVSLADVRISPCTGCESCANNRGRRNELYCIISDDMLRVRSLLNACDELVLVSPVYFAGAPSQLKAFLDRLQPYFYANWRAKPKRPASLYVVGEGGDPHGFGPLVGEVRSALAVAGFALESVHDWVGLVSADGALPTGASVFTDGRVHPASAYTCTGPEGTYPRVAGAGEAR